MAMILALLLDFGSPKSPVMADWFGVTPASVAAVAGGSWLEVGELEALDLMHELPAGATDKPAEVPPVIYTNPSPRRRGLAPTGDPPVRAPAGDYELWAVAGDPTRGSGRL